MTGGGGIQKTLYSASNNFSIWAMLASIMTESPRLEYLALARRPAASSQLMTRSPDSSLGAMMASMLFWSRCDPYSAWPGVAMWSASSWNLSMSWWTRCTRRRMEAASLSTAAVVSSWAWTQPRGGAARLSTTRAEVKEEDTTASLPVNGLPKVGKEEAVEARARSTEAALKKGGTPMVNF